MEPNNPAGAWVRLSDTDPGVLRARELWASSPKGKRPTGLWCDPATAVGLVVRHRQGRAGQWWCCVQLTDESEIWLPDSWLVPAEHHHLVEVLHALAARVSCWVPPGSPIELAGQAFVPKGLADNLVDDTDQILDLSNNPPLWWRSRYEF